MRDEGAHRDEPDLPRKARILELDLGHREAADESRVREMRDPGEGVPVRTETETVEFPRGRRTGRIALIGAVEHTRIEQDALVLGLDRKMTVAVELMNVRLVADAPVDEPGAAGQRGAARSDTAERERN